jgi:hypothetical protein
MARKALDELLKDRKNVEIEEVEIITNPLRALRDGIKIIPTFTIGDEKLSGILLSRSKIEQFLKRIESS